MASHARQAAALVAAAAAALVATGPPVRGQAPGQAAAVSGKVPQFKDITAASGLSAFTLTCGSAERRYIVETNCGGLALIDYNNDGWLDVFFVNGSTIEGERQKTNRASDRLYRNNHDGTFTDVTREAGLEENRWGMGVAVADVDNDGYDDLFVANFGQNALYLNNGNGTFRDASVASGLAGERMWSMGGAFADYDGDGNVDLYVTSYIDFDLAHPPDYDSMPETAKRNCLFYNVKVLCGPIGLQPSHNRLYRNVGGGKFVDVTAASRVGSVPAAYGMAPLWIDVDEDGKPDLYVANDRNPHFLFRNNGDGTFSEMGMLSGSALSVGGRAQAGMGVDSGDYDNDGHLDLVVTNFSEDYNTLYHGDGKGGFTDATIRSGTVQDSYPYVGWGTKLADFDNDGWLDWVVANGHVFPQVEGREAMWGRFTYKQPTLLFRNRGGGTFDNISDASGVTAAPRRVNRGLVVGDLNNNGRLDIILSSLDDGPTVLENVGPVGKWLTIKLHGTKSNRSAIGARVTARAGGKSQVAEVKGGDGYVSQSDQRVHFGIGDADKVDELTIRWPSGLVQTLKDVAVNQIIDVTEAFSAPPRSPAGRF